MSRLKESPTIDAFFLSLEPGRWSPCIIMGMGLLQKARYLITNIEPLTAVRSSSAASVRVSEVTAGSAGSARTTGVLLAGSAALASPFSVGTCSAGTPSADSTYLNKGKLPVKPVSSARRSDWKEYVGKYEVVELFPMFTFLSCIKTLHARRRRSRDDVVKRRPEVKPEHYHRVLANRRSEPPKT
jgi:hypothetical protein